MAKKTKKENAEATSQTIASKAAEKVAAGIFKQNPEIKEVHVTSDGTAFYGRNDAQNHANSLKDREVFGFKRGDVKVAKTIAKKTSSSDKTDEPEDVEIDELTGEPVSEETTKTTE